MMDNHNTLSINWHSTRPTDYFDLFDSHEKDGKSLGAEINYDENHNTC